jgi:hypothetical protein
MCRSRFGFERLQRPIGRDPRAAVRLRRSLAPEYLYEAADLYAQRFRPSDVLRGPNMMVAAQ